MIWTACRNQRFVFEVVNLSGDEKSIRLIGDIAHNVLPLIAAIILSKNGLRLNFY